MAAIRKGLIHLFPESKSSIRNCASSTSTEENFISNDIYFMPTKSISDKSFTLLESPCELKTKNDRNASNIYVQTHCSSPDNEATRKFDVFITPQSLCDCLRTNCNLGHAGKCTLTNPKECNTVKVIKHSLSNQSNEREISTDSWFEYKKYLPPYMVNLVDSVRNLFSKCCVIKEEKKAVCQPIHSSHVHVYNMKVLEFIQFINANKLSFNRTVKSNKKNQIQLQQTRFHHNVTPSISYDRDLGNENRTPVFPNSTTKQTGYKGVALKCCKVNPNKDCLYFLSNDNRLFKIEESPDEDDSETSDTSSDTDSSSSGKMYSSLMNINAKSNESLKQRTLIDRLASRYLGLELLQQNDTPNLAIDSLYELLREKTRAAKLALFNHVKNTSIRKEHQRKMRQFSINKINENAIGSYDYNDDLTLGMSKLDLLKSLLPVKANRLSAYKKQDNSDMVLKKNHHQEKVTKFKAILKEDLHKQEKSPRLSAEQVLSKKLKPFKNVPNNINLLAKANGSPKSAVEMPSVRAKQDKHYVTYFNESTTFNHLGKLHMNSGDTHDVHNIHDEDPIGKLTKLKSFNNLFDFYRKELINEVNSDGGGDNKVNFKISNLLCQILLKKGVILPK